MRTSARRDSLTLAYCGQDATTQNSLMITSAILSVNYVNATPAELEPDPAIVEVARAFAAESGATITVTNDPVEAVVNADAIYTNVWAAMGEESSSPSACEASVALPGERRAAVAREEPGLHLPAPPAGPSIMRDRVRRR